MSMESSSMDFFWAGEGGLPSSAWDCVSEICLCGFMNQWLVPLN